MLFNKVEYRLRLYIARHFPSCKFFSIMERIRRSRKGRTQAQPIEARSEERIVIQQVWEEAQSTQVIEFIEQNSGRMLAAHKQFFLPIPASQELSDACKAGDVYAAFDENGAVVASAGAFLLANATTEERGSGPIMIYDYGAACVAPRFGGLTPHTLQDLFFWLRTLGLTLTNFKSRGGICLLVSVAAENHPSLSCIRRNSFAEIAVVPDWLDRVTADWISAGYARHFWLNSDGVLDHAKRFVDAIQNHMILSRVERDSGRTRKVHVDLDVEWFNKALPVITQVVRGDISLANSRFSSIPQNAEPQSNIDNLR
jgi:hypothetical protein